MFLKLLIISDHAFNHQQLAIVKRQDSDLFWLVALLQKVVSEKDHKLPLFFIYL
jgi:hypothetical protein